LLIDHNRYTIKEMISFITILKLLI
jgi:hypothetical protein